MKALGALMLELQNGVWKILDILYYIFHYNLKNNVCKKLPNKHTNLVWFKIYSAYYIW